MSDIDSIERVGQEVAELRDLVERKLLADRQRQQMYDELYRQLEFARKGLSDDVLAPMARELLLVIDRLDSLPNSSELESVRAELAEILTRRGLREVDALGETFDPRTHEAVGRREVSSVGQVGLVIEVQRVGYLLGERLIRPARVVVGAAPPE